MHKHPERGVAIVLALFLMSAMSVLAASLMFLSQTETYASMNYRMMSQARYAGEAAVQKASDFLMDSAQYSIPSLTSAVDPLANYDRSGSPVKWNNAPVVLSAEAGIPSNYPAAAVQTAFDTAAKGTLPAGISTVRYGAYATLLTMQQFQSYGGTPNVVQTWEITGVGGMAAGRTATVEVIAVVETPKVPANNYGAFATANTCGAMYLHGNVTTDSYDSRVAGGPAASLEDSGGDVGTNGNLRIEGSVDVNGNLYTPKTGVGECSEGSVNALTEAGNIHVEDSLIQLPTAVTYPTPPPPPPLPRNLVAIDSAANLTAACVNLGVSTQPGVTCTVNAITKTLTIDGNGNPVNLPSVSIGNTYTLNLVGHSPGQTININSLSGMGDFHVDANVASDLDESIVLNVAGLQADNVTEMATPIDLSLMAWKQNAAAGRSYDSSALQIVYGGHGTINMDGGGNLQSAMSIYAPNATFILQGTQDFYGSVTARTVESFGNAAIHYDRRLATEFWVMGHPMVGTFTWKRY